MMNNNASSTSTSTTVDTEFAMLYIDGYEKYIFRVPVGCYGIGRD